MDRLKNELEKARTSSRESVDSLKSNVDQLTVDNRRLERQKADLVAAFKKQLRLIDVLRRQKVILLMAFIFVRDRTVFQKLNMDF